MRDYELRGCEYAFALLFALLMRAVYYRPRGHEIRHGLSSSVVYSLLLIDRPNDLLPESAAVMDLRLKVNANC